MKPKLMFIVNTDKFFMSHRLSIALASLRKGFEVHVATSFTNFMDEMEALGLVVHPLSLDRRSTGILSNANTFFQILLLFVRVRPNIVHLVTIKPILFGGLAARIANIQCVVAAISGLGFIFLSQGIIAELRRFLAVWLYRLTFGHRNIKVIFQNEDDRVKLFEHGKLSLEKTTLIKGVGVNLNEYEPSSLPKGKPIVMMAARLLVDKGVYEFVEAARLLKECGNFARFVLVGKPDPGNPATITDKKLKNWISKGLIEHWGHKDDMHQILPLSHIIVLPSYREGLPKILMEAAACGRAVVTTNVPGCRDAIEVNKTGLLVPHQDSETLAKAIHTLLADRSLCIEMGQAARILAEKAFDVKEVVNRHLLIYDELLLKTS